MVKNLLGHWDTFSGRYGVCLTDLAGRVLVTRDHVIVTGRFFDFGTVNFSARLLSLKIEIMDRLAMALNSAMVSDYSRLTGSGIGYVRWGDLLLAPLTILVLKREDQFLRGCLCVDAVLCYAVAWRVHDLLAAGLMPHRLDLLRDSGLVLHGLLLLGVHGSIFQ